jgi:hypothetical protein
LGTLQIKYNGGTGRPLEMRQSTGTFPSSPRTTGLRRSSLSSIPSPRRTSMKSVNKKQYEGIQEAITLILENEEDWEKRLKGLNMLQEIFDEHTDKEFYLSEDKGGHFPNKRLKDAFEHTLKDLRSQMVREACYAFQKLSVSGKSAVKSLVKDVIPTLTTVRGSGNKVNSGYIHECTKIAVRNTPLKSVLAHVADFGKTSRSPLVRESASEYVHCMILAWTEDYLRKSGCVAVLQVYIQVTLKDASKLAREWARASFWEFEQIWPAEGERCGDTMSNVEDSHRPIAHTHLCSQRN